jgi:hypothetical protein
MRVLPQKKSNITFPPVNIFKGEELVKEADSKKLQMAERGYC